jgi:hypothetical protein
LDNIFFFSFTKTDEREDTQKKRGKGEEEERKNFVQGDYLDEKSLKRKPRGKGEWRIR